MAIYSKTIGLTINFTITGLDISGANGTMTVRRLAPDNSVMEWAVTVISGAAGTCKYVTIAATDLPVDGWYEFQGRWVPDGTTNVLPTGVAKLEVLKAL